MATQSLGRRHSPSQSSSFLCGNGLPLDTCSSQRRHPQQTDSWRTPGLARAAVKRSPKRLKYAGAGGKLRRDPLFLEVSPDGSDAEKLHSVVDLIQSGGVGIVPTDTVYAVVCDLNNRAAIDRLYRIKNMDPKKPLSILCRSFQDIDKYTAGFPRGNAAGQTNAFRAARQCLPGPYTFILKASKEMPKQCVDHGGSVAARCAPRRSVGVRMPDDAICQALLERLESPLLCTSATRNAEEHWALDPVVMADEFSSADGSEGVDFVVAGGVRVADPSTVVDMTGDLPIVLRQGKGEVMEWMLAEELEGDLPNPYAGEGE